MAGWWSRLGAVLMAWGLMEGCGAPLEGEDANDPAGQFTTTSREETEAPAAYCVPDAASTQRVKSILPPPADFPPHLMAVPDSFVNFQGQLYFAANGDDGQRALWRSGGTSARTVVVKSFPVTAGTGTPPVRALTPSSSRLFFQAADAAHGEELWVSDGTTAGTRLLKDLTPGVEDSYLEHMTVLGERLVFFRALYDANTSTPSSELWTSDGTTSGTVLLRAALPEVEATSEELTLGGALLFFTQDANGVALWRTDGTKAGTVRLKAVGSANTSMYSTRLSGGRAFFSVNGADGTTAVWKSDGTTAGTQQLHTDDPSHTPYLLGVLGSSLYVATTSSTTQRMVVSRIPVAGGSETPVITLPNAYADQGEAFPSVTAVSAVAGGRKLYFTVTIGSSGPAPRDTQLWVTDGTAAGTLLLRRPLSLSDEYGSPLYAVADNLVFFSAYQASTSGIEPWVTNGTPGGTRLLKDVVPGTESSYPREFFRVGPRVYFSTADTAQGGQLWSTLMSNTCSASP